MIARHWISLPATAGPALILALLGVAGAPAALPGQQALSACYVPTVGAVYLIRLANLPAACLAAGHVEVSLAQGGGTADHGGLSGLTDDDHPQYLLANGTRSTADGFAVTGPSAPNGSPIPASGPGIRLMWFPSRRAFRAGQVDATQWDLSSIGTYSVAMGWNTTASGGASVALGNRATASGGDATAIGNFTTASGSISTAMGFNTTASGFMSTALGSGTTASANVSTAMGSATTASAYASTAMGGATSATGDYSTAMGDQTTAQAYASLVIGRFNVLAGSPTSWVTADPLFVAGNGGSASSRANALTLFKNGNLTIAGTLTQASDIRLKEEVVPLDSALDRVLRLTPIRYRFREGTGHPTEPRLGLSAQQVLDLLPELVARDAEGYLSVAYGDLSAVLVRAIQEQQREIEALRALVDELMRARR